MPGWVYDSVMSVEVDDAERLIDVLTLTSPASREYAAHAFLLDQASLLLLGLGLPFHAD